MTPESKFPPGFDIDAEIKGAIAIARQRLTEAVAFHEAYEGGLKFVAIDGSSVSPATRALPHGEYIWTRGSIEEVQAWHQAVGDAVENIEIEADHDGLYAPIWSFHWEDGKLWATHSEWEAPE